LQGPGSPFCELDVKAPIKQQLANMVILEYPVIYVFLPSHSFDSEVIKDASLVTHKPELKDSGSNLSPQGVLFKEEEIDDNNSSDPYVCDLMKHLSSSPMHQFPHWYRRSEKASNNSSEWPLLARVAAGNRSHSSSNTNEPGVSEMAFDFDQGLIDVYSDLMADINPDDFLDLEGEFAEEVNVEERIDLSGVRGVFSAEELEEGEIPE
jgi:hypothetical protein